MNRPRFAPPRTQANKLTDALSNTIALPWPPRELHPNARPHHFACASAAKAYRTQAYWLAKSALLTAPDDGDILLIVTFHPPSNRGDTDGMFSSIKAGLDGLADALGVNDRRFSFTIRRAEPVKSGQVVITIASDARPIGEILQPIVARLGAALEEVK